MKKIRIILAVSALLLAIGGTFATGTTNEYFEPLQDEEGVWSCIPHEVSYSCSPGVGEPCMANFTLRESDAPSANPRCGLIVVKD